MSRDCTIYEDCATQKEVIIDMKSDTLNFIAVGCWGVYCDTGNVLITKYKKGKLEQYNIIRGQKEVSRAIIEYTSKNKVSDFYLAGDNVYQVGLMYSDQKEYEKEIENFIERKKEIIKKLTGNELDPLNNFDMKLQISKGFENCFKNANVDRFFMAVGNHDIENCEVLNTQVNYKNWNLPDLYYNVIYSMNDFTINIIVIDTNMFEEKALTCTGQPFTEEQINTQIDWVKSVSQKGDIKIMIGHCPYLANGHKEKTPVVQRTRLLELVRSVRPKVYFCADEHNQQFIQDGDISIVVAGSGGSDLDDILSSKIKGTEYLNRAFGFVAFNIEKNIIQLSYISTENQVLFSKKLKI